MTKNLRKFSFSSRGETLVTVLVAAGIGTIIMAGLSSQLLSQLRSQKVLAQKYELMDLKQNLLITLQNSSICTYNLRPAITLTDPTNKNFDASSWDDQTTSLDETDGRIELTSLVGGTTTGALAIVTAGQPLPGTQTGLVVDKIKLKNLRPTNPTAAPSDRLDWQGIWEVSFRNDSQTIALKPVQLTQRFRVVDDATDSPETSRKIDVCLGTGAPTCTPRYSVTSKKALCGLTSEIKCSSGEVAISGGAWGQSNISLQNSAPLVTGTIPTGWQISAYDTTCGGCTSNLLTAVGVEDTGSYPTNPPGFPICSAGSGSTMVGAAVAICCRY